jgi:hypothetical protein
MAIDTLQKAAKAVLNSQILPPTSAKVDPHKED